MDRSPSVPSGCRVSCPADVDVNRRYFVHYVESNARPGAVVLDYGCGEGALVGLLRAGGFEAYGVDIRWPGAEYGDLETSELGLAGVLRYYEEGGALPFDDDFFDVVVSDQVFEHVVPLQKALREIDRVLKPDGVTYNHFPSRSVIREGHIGIPMAHRLRKGRLRLWYATMLRRLGLGIFKDDRPARIWAEEKLSWIDDWTVYRPRKEIMATFGAHFDLTSREIEYCRFRAGDRLWLKLPLSRRWLRRPTEWLFRRLAFEAIEGRPRSRRVERELD